MDNRTNMIAGWVLAAGIAALGSAILASEIFHAERPETMGYPIEGVAVEGEGGEAAVPIATLMASADPAAGERSFAKCAACHTIAKGGATGIGPNLWGSMGADIAHVAGFAYSPALAEKEGSWTFEAMSDWLQSPRAFASGTKMTFAGLGNPEERANVIAYLNQQSDSPLPLPAAPPPEATPPVEGEGDKAADVQVDQGTTPPGAPSVDPSAAKRAPPEGE